MKTDKQTRQDVSDGLRWDPAVSSAAIGVSKRDTITCAVWCAPGVTKVVDGTYVT